MDDIGDRYIAIADAEAADFYAGEARRVHDQQIASLRAELGRLRAALREIAEYNDGDDYYDDAKEMRRIARAALKEGEDL